MSEYYNLIDNSSLINYLFYPRRQHSKPRGGAFDLVVPVEDDLSITCRAFPADQSKPWLLYFHGNGEVVSDYDGIAPMYNQRGLNLLVADYRGYGASGGSPRFTDMVEDAAIILNHVYRAVPPEGEEYTWYVMGRSLGSISALELAAKFPGKLKGLIVESGFISVTGLIDHLGLPSPGDLSALEEESRRLAGSIELPALVIHGKQDRLVPLEQGKDLYQTLRSEQKELLVIPGADHNDIMFVDPEQYMQAVEKFILGQ